MFGAEVYVADLVGIAMVREMGAIMTGIIMAGRTGAAYAAQLGTMQVNEEIDALETLAVPPMEFLVLPRMVALTLMMPFLVLYANLMGILGGALVAVGMYNINILVYLNRTKAAIGLNDLFIGLFMGAVFGRAGGPVRVSARHYSAVAAPPRWAMQRRRPWSPALSPSLSPLR